MYTIDTRHIIGLFSYVFFITIISIPLAQNIDFYGISLRTYDLVLVFFLLLIYPLSSIKKYKSEKETIDSFRLLLFIVCYGFVSLAWSEISDGFWLIVYQLILALFTITIPYVVSKIIKDKKVDYISVIDNISIILSFVFLAWIVYLGIEKRFAIPSVTAAVISVIILPVIAVHLHNILSKRNIVVSIICFFVSVFSLFLTQSRIGLFIFIVYIVITILKKPSWKKILLSVLLSCIFVWIFSDSINTSRYNRGFDDAARSTMLETAISWGTHSFSALVFGNGYGEIWNWALYQSGDTNAWDDAWLTTEYGPIMYHAHSIFNQLFAELGLMGTIPFFIFIYILCKSAIRSFKEKNDYKLNVLISLLCTLPVFLTDLMIFRNWCASIIWLFYCFSTLQYKQIE